ncbi:MAG TPA: FAD-binding oxidoreductase [Candidatus Binatia bacterium]|jgi:FAD/FMN-containing dehydrogenase|nr:FAD-binding oxidoreductase [Candidatus Binatia bacterium]
MATVDSPLAGPALSELETALRGDVVRPGDGAYDAVRAVHNGMIDRRPGAIVRCADTADVMAVVNFARREGQLLAVRGGGHNAGGLGSCDGGIVADLSAMRGVRVDAERRTARVEGGALLRDLDHATHAFGLATPAGIISSTGIGGLTLGGGIGHLARQHGLTIDNLLEADVVLADGTLVTASEREEPDLFWALRGGGGNFGVVTSFLLQLHPVDTVNAGPMLWDLDRAGDVLRWYREFLPSAPERLNGFFAFLTVPPAPPFPEHLHLRKMCGIVWCHNGDPADFDRLVAPLRESLPPALDGVHPVPYPALQGVFDPLYPPGLQWYWRADFFATIPDEAIEAHLRFAEAPTMHSTMHLYPIDGAAHRAGPSDTAFGHRDATWAGVIVGVDPDPAQAETLRRWAVDYWNALHPYSTGGGYVNFMMAEGEDRIRASYRDNYGRLARIKAAYDPDNLFRVNQNIPPAR